jgi:hypothetical protein
LLTLLKTNNTVFELDNDDSDSEEECVSSDQNDEESDTNESFEEESDGSSSGESSSDENIE